MFTLEHLSAQNAPAHWREQGAVLVLPHPDDEVLFYGLIACLC